MTIRRLDLDKEIRKQSQMLLNPDVMKKIMEQYVISFWMSEEERRRADKSSLRPSILEITRGSEIIPFLSTCKYFYHALIPMVYRQIHFYTRTAVVDFTSKPCVTSYKHCKKIWIESTLRVSKGGDLPIPSLANLEERLQEYGDADGSIRPTGVDMVVGGSFGVRSLYFLAKRKRIPWPRIHYSYLTESQADTLKARIASWSISRTRIIHTVESNLHWYGELPSTIHWYTAGTKHLDYTTTCRKPPYGVVQAEYRPSMLEGFQVCMDIFGKGVAQLCSNGSTIKIRYLDDPHCFCSDTDNTLHKNVELFACPAGECPFLATEGAKKEAWMDILTDVLRAEREVEGEKGAVEVNGENAVAMIGQGP